MCHLGRYAPAVRVKQLGQVWHSELVSEKTGLLSGPQPGRFERVSSCRCSSSPASELVICASNSSAKGGALGSTLKQQEEGKGYLMMAKSSIIQFLKTCFIMRTHNSSCHATV